MAYSWDDLRGRAIARQFPATATDAAATAAEAPGPAALVEATGPIQSQTARSPFIGLAARSPAVDHAAVTAAYQSEELVRGSTIRGTVHTATAAQHPVLDATTRVGLRLLWERQLPLETVAVEDIWGAIEDYAREDWRTPDDLRGEVCRVLADAGESGAVAAIEGGLARHLPTSSGALIRRPLKGPWSGQGAPGYRTRGTPRPADLADLVPMHLRAHGPASRQDLAWWSGLPLTAVDELIEGLDLVSTPGPMDRAYLDVPQGRGPAEHTGVLLLPEFDALLCAYDSKGRDRFATPAHHAALWQAANGLLRPALLVDGRITGHWRAVGSAARRPLEVAWFAGTRKPRKGELADAVATLERGLAITVTQVILTRESI